jgi:hypothetical protein
MSMAGVEWWEIEDLDERERAFDDPENGVNMYELWRSGDTKLYYKVERARSEVWEHKRERERRVRDAGKTCTKCGTELGPDDDVFRYKPLLNNGYGGTTYRYRETTDQPPICVDCAPDWLPVLSNRVYKLRVISHTAPCENCGRSVYFVSGNETTPQRVYCCEDCKREARAARKSGQRRRVGPQTFTCEVCGESFEARRSDAKTCSSKCRQKAYRKRTP